MKNIEKYESIHNDIINYEETIRKHHAEFLNSLRQEIIEWLTETTSSSETFNSDSMIIEFTDIQFVSNTRLSTMILIISVKLLEESGVGVRSFPFEFFIASNGTLQSGVRGWISVNITTIQKSLLAKFNRELNLFYKFTRLLENVKYITRYLNG
jgi:hypothetical protein